MMINNKVQSILNVYNDNNKVKNVSKTSKTTGVETSDQLVLSTQAQSFSKVLDKVRAMSDVRMDRVDAMKSQIDAGTYCVDSKTLAQKLMQTRY